MRMNRKAKTSLTLCLALSLACLGMAGCSGETEETDDTGSEETAEEESAVDDATVVGSIEIVCDSEQLDADVDDVKDWVFDFVYDEDSQAEVKASLDAAKDGQTLAEPLVEYNPFGTNAQSLYVYFTTDEAASISYTVSVSDEEAASIEDESFTSDSIADFTREVDDGESSTEHEFQVIGLIPNVVNTVTVTATYEDGSVECCTISCDMCDILGEEDLQLEVTEGDSDAELEDGLYVILGNDSDDVDFMYYYDNDGILRGEVPIIGYRSHRLLFDDEGTMYYSCSQSRMAAMTTLGQIEHVYFLGDYDLHHDYVFDDDGNLLILATDTSQNETVEDMVIKLDTETGDVELVVDMGDLLSSYKESALAYYEENYDPEDGQTSEEGDDAGVDWMHLNSIQWMGDDSIILSSRETSSIIKISNISTDPTIDYIIASEEYWEDTEYADLVLEQVGDFTIQGGQHCVVYVEDDSLEEGQYYLLLFNNNIGISSGVTSGFDYSSIGLTETTSRNEDASSYYYKYLVDENEGTFELVDSLAVTYSGYVGSVQEIGDNLIVNSGTSGSWTEYDEDHVAIRSFSMGTDKFIYRVFKYDL